MNNSVTVHIPLDRAVKQRLDEKAKRLGFGSTQAYFRVLAQAEADGRRIDFDEDDWGQPTPEAAARLNKWADEAVRDSNASKLRSFTNVKDMMHYLHDESAD